MYVDKNWDQFQSGVKIIADSATEPGVVCMRSEAASFSGFGSLLLYQDFPLWNLEF